MDVVVAVLVGVTGVVGAVLVVVAAAAGRFAQEGRGDERLLVAPRGARFGAATDLVLAAATRAQEQEDRRAPVVRLEERRRVRARAGHHAA
ncbi:hypothetical protein AB2L27_00940 [Kineococcus sp. LSe6-4]|uniref:Secreted protein n=1 Tax=Kineococcus halophytocola TaxID=3234027 RepID=A0ABV4GY25_9ACTN